MSDAPPPLPPPLPYATPVQIGFAPPPPPNASVSAEDVPGQLARATAAWRPIGRAVRYATFDAWTLAIFAVLSGTCLMGDLSGVAVAVVLGATAVAEFVGVRRLRRLDLASLRLLAINQLALAAAIVLYSVWNLYLASVGKGVASAVLAQMGSDAETTAMVRQMVYALYATLAIVGGGIPALTAWFYLTRTRRLRSYLNETPPWIIKMQVDRGYL